MDYVLIFVLALKERNYVYLITGQGWESLMLVLGLDSALVAEADIWSYETNATSIPIEVISCSLRFDYFVPIVLINSLLVRVCGF